MLRYNLKAKTIILCPFKLLIFSEETCTKLIIKIDGDQLIFVSRNYIYLRVQY